MSEPKVKKYVGDFDYIEWGRNRSDTRIVHLEDVEIEERGDFYYVHLKDGSVLKRKQWTSNVRALSSEKKDYKSAIKIVDDAEQKRKLEFIGGCIKNDIRLSRLPKEYYDMDIHEAMNAILNDSRVLKSQSYAETSKFMDATDGKHWIRLRAMLGNRVKKTDSDAGCLRIGNENFTVGIGNGRGDGVTRYAVVNKGEWNDGMARFKQHIEGKFNIYDYDCGDVTDCCVMDTIEGRYGVYVYDGIVVLEKWN